MQGLKIGQVATQAGVGVETIRFYERKGLLEEPPRRASGYRQYPQEVVARIRFIKRAKELGFALKEIAQLLALRVDETTNASEVKLRAQAKIAEIEGKIVDLERMKSALSTVTECCAGQGPLSECPILDALENRDSAYFNTHAL